MNDTQNGIGYSIDAADEIVAVSRNWDAFALANDSPPELLSGSILHRRLWDFVSGETLQHVYRRMLAKVREGESLDFSFRCDSPALRRFLTLRVSPTGDGVVQFLTETVCTEEREFQPLFDAKEIRTGESVVACSWCNKIKTSEKEWQEPEEAVLELGLFESDAVPPLSHGICEDCYKAALQRIEARRPPVA